MGILTDAFIATDAEVAAADFDNKSPSELFLTIEAKRADTTQLARLEAIVTDHDPATFERDLDAFDEVERGFPLVRDLGVERGEGEGSDGPWIYKLSQTLVTRLSQLVPAEVTRYGEEWARFGDWGFVAAATPEESPEIVEYLGQLCWLTVGADVAGKSVYMWISL